MTNESYISLHRHDDVDALALKGAPEGVDLPYCLQQIKGWQTACRKLPRWAEVEGLVFPPSLSMEQCSSQPTAAYKQALAERLLPPCRRRAMADLTGGLGVDFSHLAPLFHEAHYVECQPGLCHTARHNLPLLGLAHATVHQTDSTAFAASMPEMDLVYADPARRDADGRRTVWLEHCTPDLTQLLPLLEGRTSLLLVKLSPMLDIARALQQLRGVAEVHVVSVEGECRELLLAIIPGHEGLPVFHCAELGRHPYSFCGTLPEPVREGTSTLQHYLFEPGAALLKAGMQDAACTRWQLHKLHPNSHLYTGSLPLPHYPGRMFCVADCYSFSKQDLKRLRERLPQANLTVRNFPATVVDLRKRLKLKEGGHDYLFATTLADGRRVLIHCQRPSAT